MQPDEAPMETGSLPADACSLSAEDDAGRVPSAAEGSDGGALAAAIYTSISFAAALIFWLVTTLAGSYPAVARYGGAVWVFILFMIVLMPVIIPRIRKRRRRHSVGGFPVGG
jgi:hypothetical protein